MNQKCDVFDIEIDLHFAPSQLCTLFIVYPIQSLFTLAMDVCTKLPWNKYQDQKEKEDEAPGLHILEKLS